MATTKEYKDFILEQLSLLDNITSKPMMASTYFIIMEYYLVEFMMIDYL